MSPSRVDDDIIYESEAVRVGIIAWGSSKTCSSCGQELPANTDYFAPNRCSGGSLTYNCRRCRRKVERASVARRKARALS